MPGGRGTLARCRHRRSNGPRSRLACRPWKETAPAPPDAWRERFPCTSGVDPGCPVSCRDHARRGSRSRPAFVPLGTSLGRSGFIRSACPALSERSDDANDRVDFASTGSPRLRAQQPRLARHDLPRRFRPAPPNWLRRWKSGSMPMAGHRNGAMAFTTSTTITRRGMRFSGSPPAAWNSSSEEKAARRSARRPAMSCSCPSALDIVDPAQGATSWSWAHILPARAAISCAMRPRRPYAPQWPNWLFRALIRSMARVALSRSIGQPLSRKDLWRRRLELALKSALRVAASNSAIG
ncbi:hypothetical protein C8D03_1079 [Bosea sp. 124]|nr:hypothetical protein C8D03_1079 [Bosea sp. 124]